jgi:hypothetical protein
MSNSTSKVSKATALARLQAIIAGTKKRFPNGSLLIGNVAFTQNSLVELFQSLANARMAADAAHARAKDALSVARETDAKVSPVLRTYKSILLDTYGNTSDVLTDFGLEPRKGRKPQTGEQMAAATVKRRATRQARGTVGNRKKLAIKGGVTGIAVTPVTSATSSSPHAAEPTSNAIATSGATATSSAPATSGAPK